VRVELEGVEEGGQAHRLVVCLLLFFLGRGAYSL
jgi:hypothetical protein